MNKKKLAILLSKIRDYDKPKLKLEQYQTDSEVAAGILWRIYMKGELGKVADLGAGTGIFSIGAALLGAEVYAVEKDFDAVKVLKKNIKEFGVKVKIVNKNVNDFKEKVDVVIMNPPFGTKERKADKKFLLKAMDVSDKIYSVHKITSLGFIEKLCSENGFRVVGVERIRLPINCSYEHHRKKKYSVEVGVWEIEKK